MVVETFNLYLQDCEKVAVDVLQIKNLLLYKCWFEDCYNIV